MPHKEKKNNNFTWLDVFRSIWHFLGDDKLKYIFSNIVLFIVSFYELVPILIVGKIIDFFAAYHQGNPLKLFYFYCIFLGVSHSLVALIRLKSKEILEKIGIAAKTRAKILGFEKLMGFSLPWHSNENSGSKVQRILTGSNAILDWEKFSNNDLYYIATSFIGILGIFLFLNPLFLLFLLTYTFLFFYIQARFNRRLKKLNDDLNASREKASGTYFEGTTNILAIKALGAEKNIHSKIKFNEEKTKEIEFLRSNVSINKWCSFHALTGIAYIFFMLLIGRQFLLEKVSLGMILVYFSYFTKIREASQRTTQVSNDAVELKSNLARMMPLFRETEQITWGEKKFPAHWQEIKIKHGDFSYMTGQMGLKNIDLIIKRNEKIGIAGVSGGGKSTLVKILLGLYKLQGGEFRIDDENYYDISHEEIIKNIAVVLQETELFNFSLRDNITIMREIDQNLLNFAIEVSSLKKIIDRLPDGLETLIGEKGYFLSGGERQRLGLARAICKETPILLLDEATASLDIETEKNILDKLLSALGGKKTIIIVAHRISTLKDTDRVIIFDNGSIVEEGKYESLIFDKSTRLGKLYALQHKTQKTQR